MPLTDSLLLRYSFSQLQFRYHDVFFRILLATVNITCFKIQLMSPLRMFFLWRCYPVRAMSSSFLRFVYHTKRSSTVGRNILNEWSVRRRKLYLTTHNNYNNNNNNNKSISMRGTRTHKIQNRLTEDRRLRPHGNLAGYQPSIYCGLFTAIIMQSVTIGIQWCVFQNNTSCC